MNSDQILVPKPLHKFANEQVVCIPYDLPSRTLLKALKKHSLKEKKIGCGSIYKLENKSVLYNFPGAPFTVLGLEILIASGAKEIILLGYCGSLNSDYRNTHALSISKALSEEGTSKHYITGKDIFYPSPALKQSIEQTLNKYKLSFNKGSTVSTDAPYRETKSWLEEKQKMNIDSVDMETSAVFCLAEFHNIKAAALLIISDELFTGKWHPAFHLMKLINRTKKYLFPVIFE
ncbi:MAG: nucleoside phosphorylase [Candidatus Aminicenantaceae bacterium]